MSHVRSWRVAIVALVALASLLIGRSQLLEALTEGLEDEPQPTPLRLFRDATPTIVESSGDWMDGVDGRGPGNAPPPDPTNEAQHMQGHALLYLLQPNPSNTDNANRAAPAGNADRWDADEIPSTASSADDLGPRLQR